VVVEGTNAGETPSFRRVLGQRPFALLWSSQLISQSGDFVFEVALLWLVLQLTGSVFAVGLVVTATLVPVVVLGPSLGVYVDRWNRRRILLYTNLIEGVAVAGLSILVLVHAADLPVLIVIVLGLASAAQFVRITSTAIVPQAVAVEDLPAANGLMSFSTSFNQIIGLSIGGVVVALFGVNLPLEYDSLTFFAAAALLVLTPPSLGAPEPTPGEGTPSYRTQFEEGFSYLRGQRYLLEAIALGVILNFFGSATSALIAPYADLVLRGGAATFGLLGASIAAGSLVGAVAMGKVKTRGTAGRWLFGGAMALSATIGLLGLTRQILPALADAALFGVLISVTNIPLVTVIQAKVPPRLMGRVMASLLALILAVAPVGAFFAGTLASKTSISTVFLLSGAVMFATTAVGAVALRELRDVSY
jgi:predicted MFS family arabinose efflux permease